MGFALGLGAFLSLSAGTACAQVDLSAWPQVRMEVLAVDRDGNPVPGLANDGVLARGTGKPRPVTELQATTEPQSVCVLLDASDADRWSMAQGKAKKLVRNLPPGDEVCVAAFSTQLWIAQEFTEDRLAVSRSLSLGRPEGGTQLRDAVFYLADYMRRQAKHRSRAIVLISDGTDRKSNMSWEQLRRGMETEGTPVVHMVCLPPAFGRARAKQFDPHASDAFKLTELGGGLTYFPHTMGDMNGVMDALPIAMSERYIVTYTAENVARDGHEERVVLLFDKAHRSQKAILQAPEGYYAPSN